VAKLLVKCPSHIGDERANRVNALIEESAHNRGTLNHAIGN
jgi:hypothetical protein